MTGRRARPTARLTLTLTLALCVGLGLGTGACLDRGVFRCQDKSQCAPDGFCESTGACSYPDFTASCSSGWRYGSHAPDALADRCVETACPRDPVVEVRAGGAHACELHQGGTVACWGAGTDGQLGDGSTVARSSPAQISTGQLGPALHLALGSRHTCALLRDGTVWCWGANDAGQLGDGSIVPRVFPGPVLDDTGSPLGGITDLAAGGAFSCAVRSPTGQVVCWGGNADGELGLGSTSTPASPTPRPVAMPSLDPSAEIVSLSAHDRHVCALTREGALWCWGANERGELGDGSQVSRSQPTAVLMPAGQAIDEIATGSAHTCARAGGDLWCWGANRLGELGDGSSEDQSLPTAVALGEASEVVAAGHHTCARTVSGAVWCWGANQAGQLGEGTTGSFGVPVPVTGVEDAQALTLGDSFSCARRRSASVWCWGDNRLGQLGNGAPIERLRPTRVGDASRDLWLNDAVAVASGGAHTCAVQQTVPPRAVCWGDNQAGQLGDGTRLDRSAPTSLKIGLDAAQIVTGALHTCLLGAASGLGATGIWCWGRGNAGQLGTSALIDVIVPTALAGLHQSSRLAAGQRHGCALSNDGSVSCWGANGEGQLGDGSVINRSSPAPVPGLTDDVVDLSLGGAHTCALHAGGTVSCWGRGAEGQLGNGARLSSSTPVTVSELTGAIGIAAGGEHTCAVLGDHTARCWGAGGWGQLGWGDLADHDVPSRVMNLPGEVVQIVAGAEHTCARTSTDGSRASPGQVFCWGDNRAGQLGNGSHAADPGTGPAPASPTVASDALDISAGGAHSCAVLRDHAVVCWGSNAAGQLGDSSHLQYPTGQATRSLCP